MRRLSSSALRSLRSSVIAASQPGRVSTAWRQTGSKSRSLWVEHGSNLGRRASPARHSSSQATSADGDGREQEESGTYSEADHEHAVISTFDLFSIGIGPSSSHTVGPMRAGNIFIADLKEANLLHRVSKIHVSLYGSLALTGEGHMTPSALLLGLESENVETVDTSYVPTRFDAIKSSKTLFLGKGLPAGGGREIVFDYEKDFRWQWGKKLPLHSNGMRLMVFDEEGQMLATNDFFSVGGGFVVNGALSTAPGETSLRVQEAHGGKGGHPADLAENLFYKEIRREDAASDRRAGAEIISPENNSARLEQPGSENMKAIDHSFVATAEPTPSSALSDEERGSTVRQPRFAFSDAKSLLALCNKHNLTIAQLVYENEKSHGYTDDEIHEKLLRIWEVMDNSILEGVQANEDSKLPGSLQLHRRAPALYRGLSRGLYPAKAFPARGEAKEVSEEPPLGNNSSTAAAGAATTAVSTTKKTTGLAKRNTHSNVPRIHGDVYHPLMPSPMRRATFREMDHLSVYAMAVNETNAAGGRVVTAPTNGAAGIIPAVLKYTVEFISDGYQTERDILTFLLTAAAIGMLYKRGATISAAEGGCMAEVGVACSMAAGAFAACMGARPETVAQAAEIGIEHNLGLTCDPIGGLVQAPCIERNALGAVKAISSANLALSSDPKAQKVSLDDAIRAMRVTAQGMRNEFKETSLSGLATSVPVHIPVSVPDC
ncbi:serine dehydratase [Myriangium duriaei CBS 260.36]|uniref:Serine dehydratase n=1 Tax=Myriangium duriaei CBS 260.36 TaxID=1168546 RepID=A0A9P4J1P5_9PEZI|nr:serine dehydratase [Myriangium duriaei CBS 260.36]